MSNERILTILNNMLEIRLKEEPTRTLAKCREDVLRYSKEIGLIKDFYYNTTPSKNKNSYFGSCVGFDSRYKVIFYKEA